MICIGAYNPNKQSLPIACGDDVLGTQYMTPTWGCILLH